jgi:hypothetical protein
MKEPERNDGNETLKDNRNTTSWTWFNVFHLVREPRDGYSYITEQRGG